MRVTIETSSYNDRRYGKPWIGKLVEWDGEAPDLEWGYFHGRPGEAGKLEITAEPGDVIRHGQRDGRRPDKSDNEWAIVQADGSLATTTPSEAREHWLTRDDTPAVTPLEDVSDDELLAEVRRRGLSL